ncbi:hypothetical protein BU25DRAFT_334721 [Macroventuria anomochaeta]|uniref:Uncharacterized protein n=1 Tax=Macroventuria anomochaeta TaxID=301207 RepID=A0ACB6S907_9PLEO|nr:uncharacterized protein BU25DRAFT_334721 [Macroventuria anomochaeta]KAF2630691.1 hypothetical protein BU25DRAFT_334721 [Macroventuria anomochaeta]
MIRKALKAVDDSYRLRLRQSRFHGWRMGVLLGTCVSAFVLLCNIAVVVVGSQTGSGYDRDGVATVMEGNEATVSRWNTVCHIFINALSTVLLSASNYTMQVLNAPTRQEMDRAHTSGKWLDIGLLSVHNLRIISLKRAALCLILAASSLPLHLFYNASIFKIITMSDYEIVLLDRHSPAWNYTRSLNQTSLVGLRNSENTSVRLTNSEWTSIYNAPAITRYGDLFLLIDQISYKTRPDVTQFNFSLSEYFPQHISGPKLFSSYKPSREGWSPFLEGLNSTTAPLPESMHIVEGWTTESGRNSRIQISLYFMVVVLSFNFLKLTVMVSVLMMETSEYIVTLGDAAASYLERPEDLTEGRSALELDQMLLSFDNEDATDYSKVIWQPRLRRYCSSIGYDKTWTAIIA